MTSEAIEKAKRLVNGHDLSLAVRPNGSHA
jgi:hypothetical protein